MSALTFKRAVLAIVLLLSTATADAFGEILYTLTDLGSLGERDDSTALAINNRGEVVGVYLTKEGGQRAFIHDGSVMRDLGTLGGAESTARDINDNGQVVGYSLTAGNALHAFLFDSGVMTDLGTFGGAQSYAHAINNAGQIAGYADDPSDNPRAFRHENGSMIALGTLGNGSDSRGYGINEHGHVVGSSTLNSSPSHYPTHVFYHDGHTMVDLGTIGVSSRAFDVNDAGKLVGDYATGDGFEAAFYHDGTQFFRLGTLGGHNSTALGINKQGQIVGYAQLPNDEWHGFVSDGSRLIDLNTVSDAFAKGWTIEYAYGINDLGQIVGRAQHEDGRDHAILLTPVPEPSGLVALGGLVGMGLVAGWRRRRRKR